MADATARLTGAGLVLLCAALVVRERTTPAPVPATAPAADFSSERAMRLVRAIAERPHPTGSADNVRVRTLLIGELRALGLETQVQEATAISTRYPVTGHIVNIVARLPGRTPGGKAVMLAAHYDGVGAALAASDDGSGTAAMLETLRAIRAGPPLAHDVIALITDGEEAGLLGAAAFVREHPWAKDVGVTLNFEARGVRGRAYMFETGKGNLDAVHMLGALPDVSASSLTVTVYRMLPNDTDLTEYALLGQPAFNFAYLGGVQLYHTPYDDARHISAGSLQHVGSQMLALTRAFGNGPLPRPVTGDAIFFDLPFIGLVIYPETWAVPFALAVTALTLVVLATVARRRDRWVRSVLLGVVCVLAAAAACGWCAMMAARGLVTLHERMGWDGSPEWAGIYAAALAAFAFALSSAVWALARRRATGAGAHAGALLVWTALLLATAIKLPGVSFLFVWPAAAAALAALVDSSESPSRVASIARWLATAVACAIVVPLVYATGGVTLPLDNAGGLAAGVLVALLTWLLLPQLEVVGGERRWMLPAVALALSIVLCIAGLITVRRSTDAPAYANLVYAANADQGNAWLATSPRAVHAGSWGATAIGPNARLLGSPATTDSAMRWLHAATFPASAIAVRDVPRVIDGWPDAAVLADSTTGSRRHMSVRFTAPSGTAAMTVTGAGVVHATAVDGRALSTARYRQPTTGFQLVLVAPGDSGFVVDLDAPSAAPVILQLVARSSGLPVMPGVVIPPRPANLVARQDGDVTLRYRRVELR